MLPGLVARAGDGWTVLSPATGQATLWIPTRAEASRWAQALIAEHPPSHERAPASDPEKA